MHKTSNVPPNLFPERKSATSRLTASGGTECAEKHTGLPASVQLMCPPTGAIKKKIQLHQIVVFWVVTTQCRFVYPIKHLGETGCLRL
jgi:hypothetical protein